MSEVHVIAHFKIHDGQLDRFRELADRCLEIVRAQDSGTHRYDWFIDEGHGEGIVLERYRDSNAVLEHISHVGEVLGPLTEIAELSLTLLGDPSPELLDAGAAFETRVYPLYEALNPKSAG